jgi:hypothetical protein
MKPARPGCDILVYGVCGHTCRLLASTTFSNWQVMSTNQVWADGTVSIHDDGGSGSCRFYQVVVP